MFSKKDYSKHIKIKVEKAAFSLYMQKIINKKKLCDITYNQFACQPYMNNKRFGVKEVKLMCLLRSKSYPAKNNFRKMYRNNLKCIFNCDSIETQSHIFEECEPIRSKLNNPISVQLEMIFGSIEEQSDIIGKLVQIDSVRKKMKDNLLPGGAAART